MDEAMRRFAVLQPHLEDGISLTAAARAAGVPVRTVQRWLSRYRADGLDGLRRQSRSDQSRRKLPDARVEGLALRKSRLSCAAIHRRIVVIAQARDWPVPSYSTVRSIIRALDPAMVTLALDGAAAYRDRFELIHRHRASAPNALWQADHTMLDILIRDANGSAVRPWLTAIMDDHSRAIAGYLVFTGAPSALQTSLALRQAIWRKQNPDWPIYGSTSITAAISHLSISTRWRRLTDAAPGDLNGADLQRFLVDPEVDLAPDPPSGATMLAGVPLAFRRP